MPRNCRQTLDDRRDAGVLAMCATGGGEWIFCSIDSGALKVFKREKAPRSKGGNKTRAARYTGQGVLVPGVHGMYVCSTGGGNATRVILVRRRTHNFLQNESLARLHTIPILFSVSRELRGRFGGSIAPA